MDSCIVKLNDVYEIGTVLPVHMPRLFRLRPQFAVAVNEYLNTCTEIYTKSQQGNVKARCTSFMRFLQNRGLADVSGIRYEDILAYHVDVPHKERVDRILYESSIKLFLSYLAGKGLCSHGLGWFLHYLQSGRIVAADTVAGISNEIPNSTKRDLLLLTAEEYRNLFEKLMSALKEEHLSGNIIAVYESTYRLHFIFLDMHGLDYSPARAFAWAEATKGIFKSSWPTVRRAVRLFEDYAVSGVLTPGKSYTSNPNAFDLLPEWCKAPITEFVQQREKTKMALATTHMDLNSCVRFCAFLSDAGIDSFMDLTAAAVKDSIFGTDTKLQKEKALTTHG
jgi:hypothetical protein